MRKLGHYERFLIGAAATALGALLWFLMPRLPLWAWASAIGVLGLWYTVGWAIERLWGVFMERNDR